MENKENKNKKIKAIASGVGASLLLAGTLIGSGFGFAKAVEERGEIDNIFNQRALIQSDIELEGDTTLREVGEYVNETLDFLGVNNSKVYVTTFDNVDRLIIDIPVGTYISTMDKEDTLIDAMTNSETNEKFVKEIAAIYSTALFNNNLDFRSSDGQKIFKKSGNSYTFDSSVLAQETEPETEVRSATNYGDYDFYSGSSVSYQNGVPVINVKLSKNNGKDEYLNLFKEFNEFIITNPGTTYNVWFGYEQLVEFGENVTGSEFNPEDYVSEKWIKPFYVTTSTSAIMSSRFDDELTIQKDTGFSEKEAQFYSRKINNTNSFSVDTSSVNVSLYMNEKSKVILIVMASILLIVIITIVGLMLWYLGLLGLIAASGFVLVNLFAALIYSTSGLTVTVIGLLALLILAFVSAWLIFVVANKYRKGNDDKYLSSFKRYTEKLKGFNREVFAPLITITILSFVCGVFLPAIIAATIYIVVIGNVMAYGVALLIQLSYFAIDSIMNFTKEYYDVKWSLIIGRVDPLWNKEIKYNDSLSKKRTTLISLSSIIVLLLSVFVGGVLFATTGSTVNTNMYGTESYYYNVKLIDPNSEYGQFDIANGDNIDNIYTAYEETEYLEAEVKKAFKDSGIKVKDISLVRNDEITFYPTTPIDEDDWDIDLADNVTFGFNVVTKEEITDFTTLNEKLALIDTNNFEDSGIEYTGELSGATTGFVVNNDFLSVANTEASELINITDNIVAINSIKMMLIFIIVFAIIALFIGRWGAALTVIISTAIEAIFVYAPIFLLFIPFMQILLFPVALLMSLSAGVKVYIMKKVREQDRKTEDVWIKCTETNQFLILLISFIFVAMSFVMIPALGFIYSMVFALFSLWIGFVTLITQRYVFTYFARVLTNFNEKVRSNKVSDDIRRSENSNEPQEEYIEGVNM